MNLVEQQKNFDEAGNPDIDNIVGAGAPHEDRDHTNGEVSQRVIGERNERQQ